MRRPRSDAANTHPEAVPADPTAGTRTTRDHQCRPCCLTRRLQ
nr:MAG TPA: hypothetical protein [Caudoviricetes sp.]